MLVLNIINGKCVKIKVTKFTIVQIELSTVYISIESLVSSGFVQLRENLEKGTFLKKIRENLENSGNFLTIFTTSGKTQGILFCQISLIK